MSAIKSQSIPCIINYNDDDQLLSIVVQPGSVPGDANGYTFFTDNASQGMMYPFTSTLIYNRPSDFKSTDDIQYEFRTGSQFAVVNLGSPAAPNSQVVVSQHKTIKDRIFDKDYGAWSVTPISSARASSRRSRGSDASIGAADV
ncbi:unnamed protein product [Rhizoctonia solani]|uniref:Uncharacterized protein n=1 Tax=Rhizoctonia solani TaxID=456999 RepID=A0A8H3HZB9_9AGAM|nr:unnamed protein product [Rhizoctonia solani]